MVVRSMVVTMCLGVLSACAGGTATPAADGSASAPTTATQATATSTAQEPPSASPSSVPSVAPSSPALTRSAKPARTGTRILAEPSDYGTVLFDATGQAVYLFDVEDTAEPRCYGACADAWPPVLTDGRPRGGAGTQQSLLGTTERTDGGTQVTYDGHPLYFYAHEGKDEVKCHDIVLNGGTWYAVQPNGRRAP